MIFDDTTVYNRYFEGPGGCDLASFGHCFSRGLAGAPFLWFLDVFGVRRDPVLKLPGAPRGLLFMKVFYLENRPRQGIPHSPKVGGNQGGLVAPRYLSNNWLVC